MTFAPNDAEGLAFEDPYNCGAGFFGDVAGGNAPYTIAYSISGPAGTYDLGSFSVPQAGHYDSPVGFIDYAVIPDAVFSVSITISDSSNPPLSLTRADLFSALITDQCDGPVVVQPAITPIPTAVFVPASPVSTGHLVTAADNAISAPKPAPAADAKPKELALTGIDLRLVSWALWLIAVGALFVGAPWGRRPVRRSTSAS